MADEADCVTALREAAHRLGESPTRAQYDELGLTPAGPTIQRTFGGWNAAKRAADLETYDQGGGADPTPDPKPDDVTLPDGVEWVSLTANQRWYYKNREYDIERREERRQELQAWVREQKAESDGCERCEEAHPATLEYHHPGEKFKSISRMVRDGHSRDRMLKEMSRCELLCANCHRKLHDEALESA
ncbi:HNH endonuclease [Halorubellus sp. JP-L1]|uniref:homing endonuclease associated repeat-containing protein n=1 Tax=Halorubellus sp. JP-L1 TaxID=2715753 RepID=UPI00140CDC59|nr:HNH endonuclease [Halorubellus sp. JP-L1]NHN43443.1 HNH endonuclease [Halorubellus sp. JP-L1]